MTEFGEEDNEVNYQARRADLLAQDDLPSKDVAVKLFVLDHFHPGSDQRGYFDWYTLESDVNDFPKVVANNTPHALDVVV